MNTASPTLANRLWPVASSNHLLRAALLAILGSALVAICAQVNVPMVPVPMTLQTLAVLAIGGAYGSRLGAAVLYIPSLAWLSTFVGGFAKAVEYGLTPFIAGDLVKAALAALAFPAAWQLLGRR